VPAALMTRKPIRAPLASTLRFFSGLDRAGLNLNAPKTSGGRIGFSIVDNKLVFTLSADPARARCCSRRSSSRRSWSEAADRPGMPGVASTQPLASHLRPESLGGNVDRVSVAKEHVRRASPRPYAGMTRNFWILQGPLSMTRGPLREMGTPTSSWNDTSYPGQRAEAAIAGAAAGRGRMGQRILVMHERAWNKLCMPFHNLHACLYSRLNNVIQLSRNYSSALYWSQGIHSRAIGADVPAAAALEPHAGHGARGTRGHPVSSLGGRGHRLEAVRGPSLPSTTRRHALAAEPEPDTDDPLRP
jgi:hypothetical protein